MVRAGSARFTAVMKRSGMEHGTRELPPKRSETKRSLWKRAIYRRNEVEAKDLIKRERHLCVFSRARLCAEVQPEKQACDCGRD